MPLSFHSWMAFALSPFSTNPKPTRTGAFELCLIFCVTVGWLPPLSEPVSSSVKCSLSSSEGPGHGGELGSQRPGNWTWNRISHTVGS